MEPLSKVIRYIPSPSDFPLAASALAQLSRRNAELGRRELVSAGSPASVWTDRSLERRTRTQEIPSKKSSDRVGLSYFWETQRIFARPTKDAWAATSVIQVSQGSSDPRVLRSAAAQTFLLFPQIKSGHEPNGWSHKCVPQMFQRRREGKRSVLLCMTGAAG